MAATAALAGLSLAGAYMNSVALGEQAKNEELNAKLDADVLRTNARLKEKAGSEEAQALLKKGAKLKGQQRAALAASGVSVDYGSAADVQAETEMLVAQDAERIRNNATLEAFGYRSKATRTELQGKADAQALRNRANSELIGGIASAGAYAYGGFSGMGKIKVPSSGAKENRRAGQYYDTAGDE